MQLNDLICFIFICDIKVFKFLSIRNMIKKVIKFTLIVLVIGFLSNIITFSANKPLVKLGNFETKPGSLFFSSESFNVLSEFNLLILINNIDSGLLSVKNTLNSIFYPGNNFKIVIDPGHGGVDPGTTQGGIYEKDINLSVAKKLKNHLVKQGFQIVMTREDDRTLSLKRRVSIAKSEKPDMFISIHANSSWDRSLEGVEIYWNTFQSKHLAERVEKSFINMALADSNIMTLRSRYYVIRNANFPAILVEIGYMSNENERYKLLSKKKQNIIAKAIGKGILQYFNSKKDTTSS
ncbi:MAG: hypothetical protein A2255_07005 [Candidatus Melainabacteria bacterium RIFOXYA2_FULL_32_9]|nr:MAG: hypothetical protein A2255_07005 [Candidatus Melainabacteria bacterium RIFOXYA2_FULL_32_9]